MSSSSSQKPGNGKRSSIKGLRGILKRNSDSGGKVVKTEPKRSRPFWRSWPKRYSSEPLRNENRLQAIYSVDISIATAIVICFALAVLLLVVKEIGLTARHCVKWDLWTFLAMGKRSFVMSVLQRLCYKIWEGL
ncbi:LAME_0G13124g1_1 [Lachancea meyersii CBS 8951]|uniref:LAME_0G13124g1_1 n=1 Tax=Lachancea meyersii CBS 8951 TaxID=1266667 RepID=A0A1G4K9Y6_9SACH|nr:LAME_0G13124g1_1 [Lachancea meyersii CBS 8951]